MIKVGDLGNITHVNSRPFLNHGRNFGEDFVHDVEIGVVVGVAEADDDEAVVFAEDGLVDVPACVEVGEQNGTHRGLCWRRCWIAVVWWTSKFEVVFCLFARFLMPGWICFSG